MKRENDLTDPTNPTTFHRDDPKNEPLGDTTSPLPTSDERMPNEVPGLELPEMVKDARIPPPQTEA